MHHRSLILGAATALALPLAASALDAPTYVQRRRAHPQRELRRLSLAEADRPDVAALLRRGPALGEVDRARASRTAIMPPWDADPGYGPWKNDTSLDQARDRHHRAAGSPPARRAVRAMPPSRPTIAEAGVDARPARRDPRDRPGRDRRPTAPTSSCSRSSRPASRPTSSSPRSRSIPATARSVHHVLLWMANESGTAPQAMLGGWAAGATPNVMPGGHRPPGEEGSPAALRHALPPVRPGDHRQDPHRRPLRQSRPEGREGVRQPLGDERRLQDPGRRSRTTEATSSYMFSEDVTVLSAHAAHALPRQGLQVHRDLARRHLEGAAQGQPYDFNWQNNYDFVEPLEIPAGSRIDCVAHWDNSEEQPRQPRPHEGRHLGPAVDRRDDDRIRRLRGQGRREPEAGQPVLGKLAEFAETVPRPGVARRRPDPAWQAGRAHRRPPAEGRRSAAGTSRSAPWCCRRRSRISCGTATRSPPPRRFRATR